MSEENESKSVESPLWKLMNNKPKSLRQPNCSQEEVSVASGCDNSENEPEAVEQKNIINKFDGKVLTSTLNVNAAEFIPYSQQNQATNTLEELEAYIGSELQCLALNPGFYSDIVEAMREVLIPFRDDEEVIKSVINIILYQSIFQQNLHYSGARLCSDLQKIFGNNFRTMLLSSCVEEYTNLLETQSPFLDRLCGFGLFISELYFNFGIAEDRIAILGEALFKLLNVLLENKDEKAIKCVCQILKLTGVFLEECSESSPAKMNELFSRLRDLEHQYPDLDPNLSFTINNVIRSRDSNWGRNESQPSSSVAQAVNADDGDDDESVFFLGPDGLVITNEENSFLHDNKLSEDGDDCLSAHEDTMNEEMFTAYEQFLKLNEEPENGK